jgi:hypothetical protein
MKKFMFVLMVFSVLAGSCLAVNYSVSGKVYQKGTTIPVPSASVTLSSSSGLQSTVFADSFGSFSVYWGGITSEIGNSMKLVASSGAATGQTLWTASQNTETKNVEIAVTIQADPSLDLQAMPAHWVGSGVTGVTSSLVIQATSAPVQVQNAQINLAFNGPIVGVANVVPTAEDVTIVGWSVPVAGQLQVGVVVNPPRPVPDFPAESFFDVYFEVDIPEADAIVATVTVDEALFNDLGGTFEFAGRPSETEYLVGEQDPPSPYFFIDDESEWLEALNAEWPDGGIIPMSPAEWNHPDPNWGYMAQWFAHLEEGDPYPIIPEFFPPELYVYGGGDDGNPDSNPDPDDAGLVMRWSDDTTPSGDLASAWKLDYGKDPDLTNCIVTVTATPPSGIANISLGLQDMNGYIRSWHWTCGPGMALPHDVPTTIRIDTSMIGLSASTPPASGFANNPLFDLTTVQFIVADENGTWVDTQPVFPPGAPQMPGIWNYWHNLSVIAKTNAYKGSYVKFSQPPQQFDQDLIYGWDVQSFFPFNFDNGVTFTWAADDWICPDERPVTDVHWWGSFIGWTRPEMPPVVPDYFIMAIWKDVPADLTNQPPTPSHPKELLWVHHCDNWVWNYAGVDQDPRFEMEGYDHDLFGEPQLNETCFQFNQLLSEDDWFYQEPMQELPDGTEVPNIYWFSISAVYDGVDDIAQVEYPWGWKTKPYDPNKAPDPAVVITALDPNTPPWDVAPGVAGHITEVIDYFPIILPDPSVYPDGTWFDLAFELTTNEPKCPGLTADLNEDCIVSLPDFAIMAQEWLMTSP